MRHLCGKGVKMLTWEEIMDILGAPSEIIECDDGYVVTVSTVDEDDCKE